MWFGSWPNIYRMNVRILNEGKKACEVNHTRKICSCKTYCARIAVVGGALTPFFLFNETDIIVVGAAFGVCAETVLDA